MSHSLARLTAALAILASFSAIADQPTKADPQPAKLADAPANTWIKLAEEKTGERHWPMFYFDPNLSQFVLTAGGARRNVHFDTELFDLAAGTWTNAYPKDAPYKNATGPTDAPGANFRDTDVLKADANGVMRIWRSENPYMREPGAYFSWAFHVGDAKLYAYFQDLTLAFDPATRTWSDLAVPPFTKTRDFKSLYGSLAYDPVNKEIVAFGGTSNEDGGSPGTWALRLAERKWVRIAQTNKELTELNVRAERLVADLEAILNACRNRHYATERPEETSRDLPAAVAELRTRVETLAGELSAVKADAAHSGAAKVAATESSAAAAELKSLADRPIGTAYLVAGQTVLDRLMRAERALDVEPCGRGITQLATDPTAGAIVMFGGCRLDSHLADTWVYDCKTRMWQQRFPKVCPAPRSGHTLAFLPKSAKIVLFGGAVFSSGYGVPHGNPAPPRDVWTYDLASNTWKLLAAPAKDAPADGVGAVAPDDTLVVVSRDTRKGGRLTWGMRIDPSAVDAGSDKAGVSAGSVTMCFNTPTMFDAATQPDAPSIEKLLKDLPANTWVPMPSPAKIANQHPWGTTPYDMTRHQFLSWGGGHSAWHFTDMGHYSLRTATWSTGYADEYPFASSSFKSFFNQTFNNRPATPTHVWDAAAYDPVCDRAVFCMHGQTWTYDPATRRWDYPPTPQFEGGLTVSMKATPRGVVHWGNEGKLHLFDGKARKWNPLPMNGQKLPAAYGDTSSIVHDSKRDCLWLAHSGGPMFRYDIKSGEVTKIDVTGPEFVCWREAAYIPELDMIMTAGRSAGVDGKVGNFAYDISAGKWVGLELPCSAGPDRRTDKSYGEVSLALHYDPTYKVAVFLHRMDDVLVCRFDPAGLKTFAVQPRQPKKR